MTDEKLNTVTSLVCSRHSASFLWSYSRLLSANKLNLSLLRIQFGMDISVSLSKQAYESDEVLFQDKSTSFFPLTPG